MDVQPLYSNVLLKPLPPEEVSPGGIILPEQSQRASQQGLVMAVGPGKRDEKGKVQPLTVKEWDVVIYSRYGGTEIKIQGEEYILIDESQLYAIVHKKAAAADNGQLALTDEETATLEEEKQKLPAVMKEFGSMRGKDPIHR